jgi:Zn-dependent protease
MHISWFAIIVLLTWGLATRYFPLQNPGATSGAYWVSGVLGALLIAGSVLFHEIGHAVLAVRGNLMVRSINLLMFGGATRIGRKPQTAGADFGLAVAGPLASLALVGIAAAVGSMLGTGTVWGAVCMLLLTINLLLAASNLIPVFPLDGGRALRALLWRLTGSQRTATRSAAWFGLLFAVVSIGIGVVLAVFGSLWPGLLLAFAGLYLLSMSRTSLKQLRLQHLVANVKVRDMALVPCLPVPSVWSLDRAVADHSSGPDARCFLVTGDGSPEGLITPEAAESAIRQGKEKLALSNLMTPLGSASSAAADEDLWSLLERLVSTETDALPVTDQGRFLGLLTRDALWEYICHYGELAASK